MRSKAAIARLRAYKPPPFPTWDRLPVSRRAAVLVLLFADRGGDLRVVITMRAASLRSFSGKHSLPASLLGTEELNHALTGEINREQAMLLSREEKPTL